MKKNSRSSSSNVSLRAKRSARSTTSLTIEQFAQYICPQVWDKAELLRWPPDVFALAASLLHKSGSYSRAVSGWKRSKPLDAWVKWIAQTAKRWRATLSPPKVVRQWHKTLSRQEVRTLPVLDIANHKEVYDALLHLC